MNRLKWIVIGALLCLFSEAGAAGKDWVKYVNTLQGTNSSFELSRGNTYPAVAMPWGISGHPRPEKTGMVLFIVMPRILSGGSGRLINVVPGRMIMRLFL